MKSLFPQAELSKIDNLGLGDLDCNSPGDLTKAANTASISSLLLARYPPNTGSHF